ncbi:hypothetical protein SAMN04488516_101102 [Desulfonauticus submarinus]|uniref:Uncharacterized protein n=1 Tax=Desulfonauticus submarinus TaxID=206665 RepID=A0A1G9ZQA2_9BACT|nr:hypothetical protein [Desulfonauticus submarinus]SDN22773.1 hypothetical protein SAMN04488516_101102 [Desulfonauticus submarinus]
MGLKSWKELFTQIPNTNWLNNTTPSCACKLNSIANLKFFLDIVQIKLCLVKPYFTLPKYPIVEARELLPSFEADLYEYENLPGFSLVALERNLDYFNEIFQFDILHSLKEHGENQEVCPLPDIIQENNLNTFLARLPKTLQEKFRTKFKIQDLTSLASYPDLLPFILQMDRGHVLALNGEKNFYLAGIYASFPSDLDTELKRFGLRIKKFKPNDNILYELNRNFVYQFLMELYGFPIVSERRTSAALFARRLYKLGEKFLIRVLGQSDRTITTLYYHPSNKFYPKVEKIALVEVDNPKKDVHSFLMKNGFYLDEKRKVVILRVLYKQHKYDPNNIREDRALSISEQEIIHPLTGEVINNINIIKDTYTLVLKLNDIIKGEFTGRVKYKREIVEGTDTHEKRLKFLYSWLSKHQRRIIGYSDEFYANVTKVLDNYLLNSDMFDIFNEYNLLYREVWEKYSYIRQARKIKTLEDLKNRVYNNKKIDYLTMLELCIQILNDLRFEAVNYFEDIISKAISIIEKILNDRYLQKKYIQQKDEKLTTYGLKIKKLYGRLVALFDELKAIQKNKVQ